MALDDRSAVVAGLGVVAPLGVGIEAFWSRFSAGEPAIDATPPPRAGTPVPARASTLAARGFEAEEFAEPKVVRRLARLSAISLIAARTAFEEAASGGTAFEEAALEEAGVVLGTAFGCSNYHFEYYESLFRSGLREASPLLFSESVLNAASGHITSQLGLRGPGLALIGGEDAGLTALIAALDLVRAGQVPFALAGGADEHCGTLHAALAARGAVGDGAGEPYAGRSLLCQAGEGAAMLFLEEPRRARERGARILARVLGGGSGRSSPGEDPARATALAARLALADAGIEPGAVDWVIGGASGGSIDAAEARGLAAILDPARPLAVTAPKRLLGEAFGFSSAAQALIAVLGIAGGAVPPAALESGPLLPPAWRRPQAAAAPRLALAVSATRAGGATALVIGK